MGDFIELNFRSQEICATLCTLLQKLMSKLPILDTKTCINQLFEVQFQKFLFCMNFWDYYELLKQLSAPRDEIFFMGKALNINFCSSVQSVAQIFCDLKFTSMKSPTFLLIQAYKFLYMEISNFEIFK